MDGQHSIAERPQLWWRRFRDFRLAETAELHIFDNPDLCLGALLPTTDCSTRCVKALYTQDVFL
jgi:hypothetical protein